MFDQKKYNRTKKFIQCYLKFQFLKTKIRMLVFLSILFCKKMLKFAILFDTPNQNSKYIKKHSMFNQLTFFVNRAYNLSTSVLGFLVHIYKIALIQNLNFEIAPKKC
jgi:hypothetical protein